MCRYESGFFYRHELLQPYKYYWRLECAHLLDPFPFHAVELIPLSPLCALYHYYSPNVQYCESLRFQSILRC